MENSERRENFRRETDRQRYLLMESIKKKKEQGENMFWAAKHWSMTMCLNHWAMALIIVILLINGFYLASPFSISTGETWQKFSMANMRFIHLIFGLLLTTLFIWRLYLAFFSRFHADWKDFFAWLKIKNTIQAIKFYTLITTEPPVHVGIYGSLQSAAYLFLLVMVFLIVLTGLILYGALHSIGLAGFIHKMLGPIEHFVFGGLAGARRFHHILSWGFVFFIIIHTYLAFWYDAIFKEGIISSIVGGRFFKEAEEQHWKMG